MIDPHAVERTDSVTWKLAETRKGWMTALEELKPREA